MTGASMLTRARQGQSVATALSYFFTCWCYAAPIIGAVVADTYLGRYKTICCGTGSIPYVYVLARHS